MKQRISPSESSEVEVPPLSIERFAEIQNNFFLQFLDVPYNSRRCEGAFKAVHDKTDPKSLTLKPLIIKLQSADPDLEERLTRAMTEGDAERNENIQRNMSMLYEAYLILRKYLEPGKNEGEAFDFSSYYPPK